MWSADLRGDVASTVAACFLSLVFLRALLHKLGRLGELTGIIREYRLLPRSLVPPAAALIVACEAGVVVGLVMPQTRTAAAFLACGLLLVYAAAIWINLLRGRTSIDCGCGGAGQGISRLHVMRNILLALCSTPAMVVAGGSARSLAASAVTAGCVFAVWFLFLAYDQLLGNRAHAIATEYSSF